MPYYTTPQTHIDARPATLLYTRDEAEQQLRQCEKENTTPLLHCAVREAELKAVIDDLRNQLLAAHDDSAP